MNQEVRRLPSGIVSDSDLRLTDSDGLTPESVREYAESGGRILVRARAEAHAEFRERAVMSIWGDSMGAQAGEEGGLPEERAA